MKNIIVLGGGTAGLVSALIMKRTFDVDITIVKSEEIGIIGVGEGSTEHWLGFLNYCKIDWKELIRETDATIKYGIYFTNGWSNKNYYHNVITDKTINLSQHHYSYLNSIASNEEQIKTTDTFTLDNLVLDMYDIAPNQFHFNTHKLNQYLLKKCMERGIKVVHDTIEDVYVTEKGISKLVGNQIHQADFYIDCTGFKRLLISELGAKWKSYSDHLFMNEAIAFPTEDTEEYTPYTEARKMNAGWLWRIPTFGRWGNGYVYNNNLIDRDKALEEVEKQYGHKIDVAKNVNFEPGALDKAWIKNCLAVGLCANFVEPLEASSIGTTIQQMWLFTHYYIDKPTDKIKDTYNEKLNLIMSNIRDFILIHYLNEPNLNLPKDLKEKLKLWKQRPPIDEDFDGCRYYLFWAKNFIQVLHGMQFWSPTEMRKYLNTFNETHTSELDLECKIKNLEFLEKGNTQSISHKKWLKNIRNNNSMS